MQKAFLSSLSDTELQALPYLFAFWAMPHQLPPPAKRPLGDPSFRYTVAAFQGNGLRPYPVAHLRARQAADGLHLAWIRCSRIDGDLWGDADVPLGEAVESYQIRVIRDGIVRRSVTLDTPVWHYPASLIAADHGGAAYRVEVAQVSDRFGPGPFTARIVV